MIKIERYPIPPASLAVEKEKKYGSYSEPDVIEQLKKDFYDKCYICELKNLSDPEVEHLRPHYNRKIRERVFDWNNLFYVCPHCNLVKKSSKYNEKILDCCVIDPENVLLHVFYDGHVKIHSKSEEEKAQTTADLIENCFEKRDTGIRVAACQHRIRELSNTMNLFYKILKRYKERPDEIRYQRSLKQMLSRESQFAAFKRNYIREHLSDYPGLEDFISRGK